MKCGAKRWDSKAADMYEQILYEVDDPVATITLNRPQSLNGWTMRMAAEVRHAVWQAENDRAVVGIIITGAGRAFCAGADMGDLTTLTEGGTLDGGWPELEVPTNDSVSDDDFRRVHLLAGRPRSRSWRPSTGRSRGWRCRSRCAATCDSWRPTRRLITAFARRGLIAEWGLSWLLPRIVGTTVAMDLLISSRRVLGDEAARLGLVNASMPVELVVPHSRAYIDEIAATCSPASIAIIKRQVYEQSHRVWVPPSAKPNN